MGVPAPRLPTGEFGPEHLANSLQRWPGLPHPRPGPERPAARHRAGGGVSVSDREVPLITGVNDARWHGMAHTGATLR